MKKKSVSLIIMIALFIITFTILHISTIYKLDSLRIIGYIMLAIVSLISVLWNISKLD